MNHYLYFSICLILFSCTSEVSSESELVEENIDSVAENFKIESLTSDLDSTTVESYEEEVLIGAKEKIEKTFGKQWDFCDCIHKTDSIQNAIENAGDISDEEFDGLMSRFEEIDQHCKALVSSPNTTPEERKAHERKVKKCLKNKK